MKMENDMSFSNYGFIMKDAAYSEPKKSELKVDGFITTVYCVGNNEVAGKAANDMADAGAQLVELCGAFNEDDVKEIIEAVNGKTAIGFASMSEDQLNLFLSKINA